MLDVNGTKLCSLCFSQLTPGSSICTHCTNIGNKTQYPVVLKEGTILAGRYSVGKVLGKGGFGVTYLCYDLVMHKKVAIKEFFPDSIACRATESGTVSAMDNTKSDGFKNYAMKFYEEAKLVSKFNGNPNVISVYEFFYENNTAYFVMEALEGMDLKHYLQNKGGKIDIGEALFVISKMLDALMVVHSAGVLHRDISPDNIYICQNGDIKLIDFGAARQVIGEESKSLSVILKQGFAPLEQYQKKGTQGPWTDIYALGATLYYILTGKLIDDAMSRLEAPELDMRGIPGSLAQILQKMLELKHTDRYQSVFEVKSAINALNQELVPIHLINFCQMCGKEISFGEKICSQCSGQTSVIPNNSQPVVPQQKKPGFLNKWIILASGLGLALVVIIIIIALILSGSSDNGTPKSSDGKTVVTTTTEGTSVVEDIIKDAEEDTTTLTPTEKKVAEYVETIKADAEMDDEQASLKIEAKGTSVVYTFTIKDSALLETAVDDVLTEFESSKNFLRKTYFEECPEATSFVYEIYDNQGKLLNSQEILLDYSEDEQKVEAYVELMKEETEESTSDDMYKFEIEARRTSIVFKITVLDSYDVDAQAVLLLDEFAQTKDDITPDLNENLPEVTSIICEIYNTEGELIDSEEYEV